jgi:hypothetical protein
MKSIFLVLAFLVVTAGISPIMMTQNAIGQIHHEEIPGPVEDSIGPPDTIPHQVVCSVDPQVIHDTVMISKGNLLLGSILYSGSASLVARNFSISGFDWWAEHSDFFTVVPESGHLDPFESQSITVYWNYPSSPGHYCGFIEFRTAHSVCTVWIFIEVIGGGGPGGMDQHDFDPAESQEMEEGGLIESHGNFPNPFNPVTEIRFDLAADCDVKLDVYNVLGQKIAGLIDRRLTVGSHSAIWNMTDPTGDAFASGVYFYRLQAGKSVVTRKMLLMK